MSTPASDKQAGSTFYATTETALYSLVGHNNLVVISGCSTIMVRNRQLFLNLVKLRPLVPIMVGNNQMMHAAKLGTLKFGSISLSALFVPSLACNLLVCFRLLHLAAGSSTKAACLSTWTTLYPLQQNSTQMCPSWRNSTQMLLSRRNSSKDSIQYRLIVHTRWLS